MAMLKKSTTFAAATLIASAILFVWCVAPNRAGATFSAPEQREADSIAELTKRVPLEAELADLRKALLKAGGGAPILPSKSRTSTTVAKLRTADLISPPPRPW